MDWNVIKAEYIAGGTSYRALAKKYDVSIKTLGKVAKREKWVELRQRAEDMEETRIVEEVSKRGAKIDETYYRIVDKLLKKTEELVDSTVWTVYSVKEMASALKYLKECKGLKSEADIREQNARIKNLEKQVEKADNTAAITVTFDAGPEEWNE